MTTEILETALRSAEGRKHGTSSVRSDDAQTNGSQKPQPHSDLFEGIAAGPDTVATPRVVLAVAPTAKVTEAYDTLWRFAYERQHIYFRRLRGESAPWTEDNIIRRHRFTNAYRAADRVSQYLIKHVIYRDDLPKKPSEVVFRILLFKLFNRIQTWETLTDQMDTVTLADNPFARIDEILTDELRAGRRIYSAAYIMPTSRTGRPLQRKHQMHLALLQRMMEDRLPDRLADTQTMKAGFDMLRSYPGIGDFLAYQFITDINYSEVVDFSEAEFVAPGPGAREGLRKCFVDPGELTDAELIRMTMDVQEEEFQRLGLDFQTLFGRRLQLIDCQNLFCEVAKYARVRFPDLTPPRGRTRIKQKYRPSEALGTPVFPPKWRINDVVGLRFPPQSRPQNVDFAEYQRKARATSRHLPVQGGDGITTPMLGLIGETGEVISELKKHVREGSAYVSFRDRLVEELGDLLWYVADIASRRNIRLEDIYRRATVSHDEKADSPKKGSAGWIRPALAMAEETGRISRAYRSLLAGERAEGAFNAELSKSLVTLIGSIKTLTTFHELQLADITKENIAKVEQRWALPDAPFASGDVSWPEMEQLPTHFDAWLTDLDGRVRVSFLVDGLSRSVAPDTLTDNAYDPDGYRFHDVFHFAYAAVLGWSPITRSLLRRKRKSDPRIDEIEDGGRAAAIEEGISTMVFAYAKQHRMFEGVDTVEYSVLRTIREMTRHLEVKERTAAEWQDAILQGFRAWRNIRDASGGCIRADRLARRIVFADEGPPAPINRTLSFG